MKKYGIYFFAAVFVVIIISLLRWYPSYKIKFNGINYHQEDLQEPLSNLNYLYNFLLNKMCKTNDCSFYFNKKDFPASHEKKYYLDQPKDLSLIKLKTAKSQFLFSLLKEQVLIINEKYNKLTVPDIPWYGSAGESWWIQIQYSWSHPLAKKMPLVIKRLTRDYPNLKIYLQPLIWQKKNQKYIQCLQQNKIFWDAFFKQQLDQQALCLDKGKKYDHVTDQGIEIFAMNGKKLNYKGYLPFIKQLQTTYLLSKFQH